MRKDSDKRRFIYYVLYAWGGPLIITGITLALDIYEVLPKEYQTGFGQDTVWFPSKYTTVQRKTTEKIQRNMPNGKASRMILLLGLKLLPSQFRNQPSINGY